MKVLTVVLRCLLKIGVCAVGSLALVGLLLCLFSAGLDPLHDQEGEGLWIGSAIFGAYVGILWCIEKWRARHWLIWSPLVGFVIGMWWAIRRNSSDFFILMLSIGVFVGVVGALNAVGAFGSKRREGGDDK